MSSAQGQLGGHRLASHGKEHHEINSQAEETLHSRQKSLI